MNGRNGSIQTVATTMTTGVTVSTFVYVMGAEAVGIEFPTFAVGFGNANNSINLQVSDTSTTGNFKQLQIMGVYSAGSGILDWSVPDNTGNRIYQLPQEVCGYKYARVDTTVATTAAVTVNWYVST